jgi:hypothetical protein
MNFDTSNNSQKILIEDDKSLLMFENKEIILVGQFKNQIIEELEDYISDFVLDGVMLKSKSYICGQIAKLDWVYYPRDGQILNLLILGEKQWRQGKIKVYGQCDFSPILEKLAHQEYDYSQLLQILKEQGFKNFNETRQIKITLEFIPENSPLEQESESPLE